MENCFRYGRYFTAMDISKTLVLVTHEIVCLKRANIIMPNNNDYGSVSHSVLYKKM